MKRDLCFGVVGQKLNELGDLVAVAVRLSSASGLKKLRGAVYDLEQLIPSTSVYAKLLLRDSHALEGSLPTYEKLFDSLPSWIPG
jgi:hypothetical protein